MIYPSNFEQKIGFDKIRLMLTEACLCKAGMRMVDDMHFLSDFKTMQYQLHLTSEMKQLLMFEENFPLDNYYDATHILEKLKTEGQYPSVEELVQLQKSLLVIKQIKQFFSKEELKEKYPLLSQLAADVSIFKFVNDSINDIIDKHGNIKDNASPELKKIRSEIKSKQGSVHQKVQKILQASKSSGFTDGDAEATIRNGRPVIPVSSNYKRKLGGIIHDESATGKTAFIEPVEIVELNNQLRELEYAEHREVIKILIAFANSIRPYLKDLIESYLFLGKIDFIVSKTRLAEKLEANLPILTDKQTIDWHNAIHPLLYLSHKASKKEIIPLSIQLTHDKHILVISGPNAGGKSVCLKTVGLLQYMLQCGILVPMSENSEVGIYNDIFIDIGDEQSIDNDLSTYSSHLTNMKHFTSKATEKTLFLIDEFGTGTEPALGGAIAEAILENLIEKHAYGVVTTHYANLKHYATEKEGLANGAMLFDTDKIKPLYKLTMGRPGSSFAIDIARKIGLSEAILARAKESIGEDQVNFDKHLREIIRDKRYWETKRQKIRKVEKRLDELYGKYGKELESINAERKTIIKNAKKEAEDILKQANSKIENTIRSIREAQADKTKTNALRKNLEEFQKEFLGTNRTNNGIDLKINEVKQVQGKLHKNSTDLKKDVPENKTNKKTELVAGVMVSIIGMDQKGEVVAIEGNKITVAFGVMQTVVNRSKIASIGEPKSEKIKGGITFSGAVSDRKLKFKPEIDVRGQRANEALATVQNFIDDAIMVSCKEIRILHGKGNGILRQLLRDYIQTVDVVQKVRDEHIERGGSGITIVEFNYYN